MVKHDTLEQAIPELKISNLRQTCTACPSQWEADATLTSKKVYIRYRYGQLKVSVGETLEEAIINCVYFRHVGSNFYDGMMLEKEMLNYTGLIVV